MPAPTDDTSIDGSSSGSAFSSILYPALLSVFSAFCLLTLLAFLISNRKCCKKKPIDPEELRLRKRLLLEKQKMAKTKLKFHDSDHPIFSSVLQQEDNDVAEEVKETYKSISRDANKPFVCCPDSVTCFRYIPTREVELAAPANSEGKVCLDDENVAVENIVPETRPTEANLDNEEHDATKDSEPFTDISADSLKLQNDPTSRHSTENSLIRNKSHSVIETVPHSQGKSDERNVKPSLVSGKLLSDRDTSNYLQTEKLPSNLTQRNLWQRENELGGDDMKDVLLTKWITDIHDAQHEPVSDVISVTHTENALPYEDVESLLTSVSRMDATRLKKLRDTAFYQKIVSGLPTVHSVQENSDVDLLENVAGKETQGRSKSSVQLASESLFRVVRTGHKRSSEREELEESSVTVQDEHNEKNVFPVKEENPGNSPKRHSTSNSSIHSTPTRPSYLPLVNRATDYNHNKPALKQHRRKNVSFAASNLSINESHVSSNSYASAHSRNSHGRTNHAKTSWKDVSRHRPKIARDTDSSISHVTSVDKTAQNLTLSSSQVDDSRAELSNTQYSDTLTKRSETSSKRTAFSSKQYETGSLLSETYSRASAGHSRRFSLNEKHSNDEEASELTIQRSLSHHRSRDLSLSSDSLSQSSMGDSIYEDSVSARSYHNSNSRANTTKRSSMVSWVPQSASSGAEEKSYIRR